MAPATLFFDAFARSILNKLASIFKTARSVPVTSSMGVCTFITQAPGPVTACVAFSSLYKIDQKVLLSFCPGVRTSAWNSAFSSSLNSLERRRLFRELVTRVDG